MTDLLLEPFGGLAGDMLLAALLDLGSEDWDLAALTRLAEALVPGECALAREEVRVRGFRATRLRLRTPETAAPPARHLPDLLALVEASPLTAAARARATRVLEALARAEARVHGIPIEDVHFHEVGAVDTLVDVCGAVHALEVLGVERITASVPYVGGGTVTGAHGTMPVPAPATAELLRDLPADHGPGGERVTPTGAALLAELAETVGGSFPLQTAAIGYGTGTRDPAEGPPNLLRVQLGTSRTTRRGRVALLEFNLDDVTGEEAGFLLAELRAAGALEAWSMPVQMKKDRPGILISALCRPEGRKALERAAFRHSPTLGVRWSSFERTECRREVVEVEVPDLGPGTVVRIKVRIRPDGGPPVSGLDLSPEYDDLARLARSTGRSLREVEALALAAARRRIPC